MRSVIGRRGWLLALVMLVALVGAGCGSDEPTDTGAQSGGTEVSGLITDGVLTVGTELPAPPFWIGENYDSLTGGFEVDLAKEIAKRLNLGTTKFVEMPFTDGEVVGQFKTGEQYGAVVNKGSPNLNAFNTVIKTLKSEGFIDQLLQKYFSDQVSVPVIG